MQGRVNKPCDSCYSFWVRACRRACLSACLSACVPGCLAAVPACTRSEVDLPGRFLSLQVGATLNILARSSSSSSSGGGSSSSSSSSSSSGGGSAAGLVAALHHGVDAAPAAAFVLRCQKPKTGGFGKWADQGGSDPLHTFFSLAGLQLMYDVQLSPSTFLAGWLAGSLASNGVATHFLSTITLNAGVFCSHRVVALQGLSGAGACLSRARHAGGPPESIDR
jgi:hypothetical protein